MENNQNNVIENPKKKIDNSIPFTSFMITKEDGPYKFIIKV
jgi:hypothetical protein